MGTVFKKRGIRGRPTANLGWKRGSGCQRQGPGGEELGDDGMNGGVLYGFQGARRVTARYPSSLIQGGISGILRYRADGRVKYLVFCPVSYGVLPLTDW